MDYTIIQPELILFSGFCLAMLLQLWYYLGIFSRLAFYKKSIQEANTPPASVIICAKNEDHNLIEFLPLVLNQNYPEFEVVVVNDCSFDNTADILYEYEKKHERLKIVTIKEDENYSHGKKFALMVGIKGAKYEHLLLTDADCKPNSNEWLRNMMSEFKGETEIVLGYGAYEKTKGILNKIIRFDTFYIAVQYLSFALANKTYMGVGRNLAYQKSLFFKLKGFASHYHIESGDDDLFVNEAATKRNSKIEVSVNSFTISRVKKTYKSWFRQKRRHITTGRFYNFSSKLRIGLLSFSQYLFYFSFITLLIIQYQLYSVLIIFSLRYLIQLFIFKKSMDKLGEKDLLVFSPVFEVFLLVFYPVLILSNLFLKKNKWKR